jgi:hypothetical protein
MRSFCGPPPDATVDAALEEGNNVVRFTIHSFDAEILRVAGDIYINVGRFLLTKRYYIHLLALCTLAGVSLHDDRLR